MATRRHLRTRWLGVAALWIASAAFAHSASDAYLTLDAVAGSNGETLVHAQWDVALRDLDFLLALDADGDGRLTWGELRARQQDVARFVYSHLSASAGGARCVLRPREQKVAGHADGAYAALFFDIACPGTPARVTLDYRLFFDVDPSHRCILVMRADAETATALLAPDNAQVSLALRRP